jgi:hypothetical protein
LKQQLIHLGFEVGSGDPVAVPLAHTFVTGQSQASGKTTTLEALVTRSGRRALAFATKRGESFSAGNPLRPYLPRQGDAPIHWRLVETILASALGEKKLKYERWWIVNAARGAKSLQDVRRNVDRLMGKLRSGDRSHQAYELIGEYLDLVLPEMLELGATDELDLAPGLNVMDLIGVGTQMQAMVIRASLEHVAQHLDHVTCVLPEAWEFAPRDRVTPATDAAVSIARKGAVAAVNNLLYCDSQDISGVHPVLRQQSTLWLFGVQRELNELARTLKMLPAGVKKPKAQDVTTLRLGQFIACWQDHAVRVQVQPAWMDDADAAAIARGEQSIDEVARPMTPAPAEVDREIEMKNKRSLESLGAFMGAVRRVYAPAAKAPQKDEDEMAKEDVDRIDKQLGQLTSSIDGLVKHLSKAPPAARSVDQGSGGGNGSSVDVDQLYAAIKQRLIDDAPALLKIVAEKPELEITVERKTIAADGSSLLGRVGRLIKSGWFNEVKTNSATCKELGRTGTSVNSANLSREFGKLVTWGFLSDEPEGFKLVPGAKVHVKEV